FSDLRSALLISRLIQAGLNFEMNRPADTRKSDKLNGLTFVVSGIFEKFSRDGLKKAIEEHGGNNVSSISSKTSYLVAGTKMGPEKLKKAEKAKIPIISEEEFLKMLQ
ncbi:MAG: BRCT domain-containing protein, partial [Bacteroidota bacterium]